MDPPNNGASPIIKTSCVIYYSMQSVQNLGLAVISLVSGKLVDGSGYLVLEVFYLCWLCGKYPDLYYRKVCVFYSSN